MAPAPTDGSSAPPLKYVPCIHHPMRFKKDQAKVQALLNSSSKVNAMNLVYTAKLGLKHWPTDVRT